MIAIVGSSGSLLKHQYGSFIDSHANVLRFNAAPTKGYEKHVGVRTGERWIAYHGEDYDLKDENIVLYSYNQKALREGAAKLQGNKIRILDTDFIRDCDNMIGKPYWKWRLMPGRIIINKQMSSTGLKSIIYFSNFSKINLFGFNPDLQYRYYEKNKAGHSFEISHSRQKENQIIQRLVDEGKIKIF